MESSSQVPHHISQHLNWGVGGWGKATQAEFAYENLNHQNQNKHKPIFTCELDSINSNLEGVVSSD